MSVWGGKRGWNAGGAAEKCLLRSKMRQDVRAGGGSDGASLDHPGSQERLRNRLAVLAQTLDVGVDRLPDQLLDLGARVAGRDAAGKVGHPCAPARGALLVNDHVFAQRSSSSSPD